eukprot:s3337_g2.t1
MSFLRDASGMEWERVEDDEDDAMSTTTVHPDQLLGESQLPRSSPSREGGSRQLWTPTMRGTLAGRPQTSGASRQLNWDEPLELSQGVWDQSPDWSEDWSWSEDTWHGKPWEADPWSSFLDSHRPGWKRRGYTNWSDDGESSNRWSHESLEDDVVPLPSLLSRKENKNASTDRAQLETDSNLQAARGDRALLAASPQGEQRALREAPAQGHGRPEGQRSAQLRGDPLSECQGQGKEGDRVIPLPDRLGKDTGPERTEGSGDKGFLKLHNSFPPEFKARPGESWQDYWRSVEFWLASEGVNLPASVRGSRLMQQMKERAGKIVNHLTVSEVATEGGVELIKKEMEKSPIIRLLEHKEVDRKRQKFMRLARFPKESLESFINRASIYRHENDRCQNYKVGTKFYLGHLLDAAKLSRKDEALIKTASQGLHDEGKVVNAMLELSDQLEGLPGFPIGKGEPDMPDEDKYLVQKRSSEEPSRHRRDEHSGRFTSGHRGSRGHRLRGKWKQVFHTIMEDLESSDQENSTPEDEEAEGPGEDHDEGEDGSSVSGDGDSVSGIPAEVFAQEYRVKKKVNEIKQMRQFYKKDPEKIKEQQKREPCFLCQKLGHWSQECPLRNKKGGSGSRPPHAVHVTAGTPSAAPEQWSLLESLSAYTKREPRDGEPSESSYHDCLVASFQASSAPLDHETFWSMRELHSSLILDLGCKKSVAGTKWVNQHIQKLRGLGRWMKAVKEKESFRFGDGHELCSEFAFIFEAAVMGVQVILRISVVPGECPPLLSKPACSQLGMIIDTEYHTISSRKLKINKYGLSQTFGGHYALPVAEFTESMQIMHAPEIPQHLEAFPVYVSYNDSKAKPDNTSRTLRSWTRHDKAMNTTVGPGSKGPPWELVVRRLVYDAHTGDKILDEAVSNHTQVRQKLQCQSDLISVFMYHVPGSGRSQSINSMGVAPPTLASNPTNGPPPQAGTGESWTTREASFGNGRQCQKMMTRIRDEGPDLVVIVPLCGPWSSWTQEKGRALRERQRKYLAMWTFIEDVWNYQVEQGRLVLLHVPARMSCPGPDELRILGHRPTVHWSADLDVRGHDVDQHPAASRPEVPRHDVHQHPAASLPEVHRHDVHQHPAASPRSQQTRRTGQGWGRSPMYVTRVDMCQFGAIDPQSLRPFKRASKVEVNDPFFCSLLSVASTCQHAEGDHQPVEGSTQSPAGEMKRVLKACCQTLELRSNGAAEVELHEPCAKGVVWETVPVDVEASPEGLLRQQLGETTGDKYDYIYFEGASGALSRELRSTLAKLHVVLGHVSTDKLKRMLHLNGAKDHILQAAGDLRCQICQIVTGPTAPPRAAYDRPQRFNERIVADTFFVWDSNNEKYAVIHAMDAFSLYQAASLLPSARADRVAHFLKNHWIGVFGPPDIVMTDAGTEFAAQTEELLRAFDIQHEIVPPTAKWRMGLAERHGAVLKLLVMKTILSTTAKGYSETKECVLASVVARNRQMRVGGFSPTQIVLGRDVAIPSSLLQQIQSAHFRYVTNQDLAFDDARRKNEEIRHAAAQSFHWADSHETLRKAVNSRSRHPRMEMLYEGAVIYFYDPPASRRGLPKQTSWTGPAVVVAVERKNGAIKRVWARYRNKLKGIPLEFVRLAALEEVEGSKVCQEALQEVEKELQGDRPNVEEMMDPAIDDPGQLLEFSGDEEGPPGPDAVLPLPPQSVLDDVPVQLHRDKRDRPPVVAQGLNPESREAKKVRFEEAMQRSASHISKMKAVLEKRGMEREQPETPGSSFLILSGTSATAFPAG